VFFRRPPLPYVALAAAAGLSAACGSDAVGSGSDAAPALDAKVLLDASDFGSFCDLPGSVVWSDGAPAVVGGAPTQPDLTWLQLPDGFCAHYYANVPETRLLRFAPNGDLFAASPSASCPGGATGGMGAIVVLPDDNGDGVADMTITYEDNLPSTQGLLFNGGYLYYQDGTKVMRTPYHLGDRSAPQNAEQMIDVQVYVSPDHWSKAIDADDNGNIFVTNGGDQGEVCDPSLAEADRPFHGGILRIDGSAGGELVAKGLRNPIALRCARGTGTCFGLELARDFVPQYGSREKLFPVRQGDDWGFPCCATANAAYSDITPAPTCTGVQPETGSFIIDHTPFDLDFEQGAWPGTWKSRVFVALHGYVGSWQGARLVAIATDPKTGWPVMSSEADPGTVFSDFATGWYDDSTQASTGHGRPSTVTFAPDGRLFVGNDINGDIFWIAPVGSGEK
jgi:glucose/arabinose dehydrogenase